MILYTSDIKETTLETNSFKKEIEASRRQTARTGYIYLGIAVFCLILGIIYEHFSHDVRSPYMMYAFLIPLVPGCVAFLLLSLCKWHLPGKWTANFYHSGIATLTVGSLVKGALDIYGTTNHLTVIYPIVGGLLLFAGLLLYIIERKKYA